MGQLCLHRRSVTRVGDCDFGLWLDQVPSVGLNILLTGGFPMFRKNWFLVLGSVVLVLLMFASPAPSVAQVEVTATQSTVAPNPTSSAEATGQLGQTPNPGVTPILATPATWVFTVVPSNTTEITITVGTPTPEMADPAACQHVGPIYVDYAQRVIANWRRVCPTATPTVTPTPTVRPAVNGDIVVPMVGKGLILTGARNADWDILVYITDSYPVIGEDNHSYDLRGDRASWAGSTLELPTTVVTPTSRYVRVLAGSSIPGGTLDVSCMMTGPMDVCVVRFSFYSGQNVIEGNMHVTTEEERRRYPVRHED